MKRFKLKLLLLPLGVAVLLLLVYFTVINKPAKPAARAVQATSSAKTTAVTPPVEQVYNGLPSRLKIPAISVDTEVQYLGKTSKGEMEVPKSHTVTGWYKYGAIPGDEGSAVIAGHVIGPKGEHGIFFNMKKLKPGDELQMVDAKGKTSLFKVRETRTYGQNEQPSEVFNSSSGTHLNLITCAGEWDAANKQYLKRLVVFADKSP
jgi:LPXTG-site transpeptidase (sortase) family protein